MQKNFGANVLRNLKEYKMKISKSKLKKIIVEEFEAAVQEDHSNELDYFTEKLHEVFVELMNRSEYEKPFDGGERDTQLGYKDGISEGYKEAAEFLRKSFDDIFKKIHAQSAEEDYMSKHTSGYGIEVGYLGDY